MSVVTNNVSNVILVVDKNLDFASKVVPGSRGQLKRKMKPEKDTLEPPSAVIDRLITNNSLLDTSFAKSDLNLSTSADVDSATRFSSEDDLAPRKEPKRDGKIKIWVKSLKSKSKRSLAEPSCSVSQATTPSKSSKTSLISRVTRALCRVSKKCEKEPESSTPEHPPIFKCEVHSSTNFLLRAPPPSSHNLTNVNQHFSKVNLVKNCQCLARKLPNLLLNIGL